MNSKRGALLVFEGIDRSGKSTQASKLVDNLLRLEIDTVLTGFPDRETPTGRMLSQYLKGNHSLDAKTTHILFVANRFEKSSEIEAKLEEGTTVVVDRYSHSGVAYTMSKKVDGLDLDWCKSVERGQLPQPDLIFYMDLPVDLASKRNGFGDEKYESFDRQKAIWEAYQQLRGDEGWVRVDATQLPDAISTQILDQAVACVLQCRSGKKLGRLWS